MGCTLNRFPLRSLSENTHSYKYKLRVRVRVKAKSVRERDVKEKGSECKKTPNAQKKN